MTFLRESIPPPPTSNPGVNNSSVMSPIRNLTFPSRSMEPFRAREDLRATPPLKSPARKRTKIEINFTRSYNIIPSSLLDTSHRRTCLSLSHIVCGAFTRKPRNINILYSLGVVWRLCKTIKFITCYRLGFSPWYITLMASFWVNNMIQIFNEGSWNYLLHRIKNFNQLKV